MISPEMWLYFLGVFQILDRNVKRPRGPKSKRKTEWTAQRNSESRRLAQIYGIPHHIFVVYEDEAVTAMNNINKIVKLKNSNILSESSFGSSATSDNSVHTAFEDYTNITKEQLPIGWDCKRGTDALKAQIETPENTHEETYDVEPRRGDETEQEEFNNDINLTAREGDASLETAISNGIGFSSQDIGVDLNVLEGGISNLDLSWCILDPRLETQKKELKISKLEGDNIKQKILNIEQNAELEAKIEHLQTLKEREKSKLDMGNIDNQLLLKEKEIKLRVLQANEIDKAEEGALDIKISIAEKKFKLKELELKNMRNGGAI